MSKAPRQPFELPFHLSGLLTGSPVRKTGDLESKELCWQGEGQESLQIPRSSNLIFSRDISQKIKIKIKALKCFNVNDIHSSREKRGKRMRNKGGTLKMQNICRVASRIHSWTVANQQLFSIRKGKNVPLSGYIRRKKDLITQKVYKK